MEAKIGKLFGVLVMGGMALANADGSVNLRESVEEDSSCNTEIAVNVRDKDWSKITCLDGKSPEEIASVFAESEDQLNLCPCSWLC